MHQCVSPRRYILAAPKHHFWIVISWAPLLLFVDKNQTCPSSPCGTTGFAALDRTCPGHCPCPPRPHHTTRRRLQRPHRPQWRPIHRGCCRWRWSDKRGPPPPACTTRCLCANRSTPPGGPQDGGHAGVPGEERGGSNGEVQGKSLLLWLWSPSAHRVVLVSPSFPLSNPMFSA
jgi:hypothetical protein